MRTSFIRLTSVMLASALLAATLLGNAARAEEIYDVRFASYANRIEALEAELASMRGASKIDYGKAVDGGACCGPTWYFHGEVPWLQVNDAGIVVPGIPVMTPHYGQEPSIRVLAGREWDNGLGFRTTVFKFNDTAGNGMLGPVALASSTDIYAVDMELTQRGQFCGWDFVTSGGVRIGGLNQRLDVAAAGNTISIARDFDGAGLTFGIDFSRPFGNTCLSVYGGMNASLLYGDADINVLAAGPNVPPINATVATVPNQTIAVAEIQLGLEYRREVSLGALVLRGGVEGQMWEQPPIVLGLGDSNVGLFGPTFSVGIER